MQKKMLNELLRTKQTVFSFKELLLIFKTDEVKALKSQLNYYVKTGDLYHIRRGLYAKDENYNRLEAATKIFTPSYISFETVLRAAGIIFQYDSRLFVASYQSREIVCDGQTYIFRTLKSVILINSAGIELHDDYSIACPERAFLDLIYLNKRYHFDNLEPLNWDKVYQLVSIYGNYETMKKRVNKHYSSYKKEFIGHSKQFKKKNLCEFCS